jgi:hypothetical protein
MSPLLKMRHFKESPETRGVFRGFTVMYTTRLGFASTGGLFDRFEKGAENAGRGLYTKCVQIYA